MEKRTTTVELTEEEAKEIIKGRVELKRTRRFWGVFIALVILMLTGGAVAIVGATEDNSVMMGLGLIPFLGFFVGEMIWEGRAKWCDSYVAKWRETGELPLIKEKVKK